MGFCHVGQAGLKLLASSDPPALVFQSVRIAGASHYTWSRERIYISVLVLHNIDRQNLTLLCSGTIIAHRSLKLLGSRDPNTSATQRAGPTEMGSRYVVQASLQLLTSSCPPTLASQRAGITGSGREPPESEAVDFTHLLASLLAALFGPEEVQCEGLGQSLAVPPGWSAVVRSQLTATSDSLLQAILPPQPPEQGLLMLPKLVSNSWPQAIFFLASQSVRITESGSCYAAQAGPKLLVSSDSPSLAS
ncbi:hypothetical protein AAY473_016767 [Plecturocebus cupreus]